MKMKSEIINDIKKKDVIRYIELLEETLNLMKEKEQYIEILKDVDVKEKDTHLEKISSLKYKIVDNMLWIEELKKLRPSNF